MQREHRTQARDVDRRRIRHLILDRTILQGAKACRRTRVAHRPRPGKGQVDVNRAGFQGLGLRTEVDLERAVEGVGAVMPDQGAVGHHRLEQQHAQQAGAEQRVVDLALDDAPAQRRGAQELGRGERVHAGLQLLQVLRLQQQALMPLDAIRNGRQRHVGDPKR